jgi:hypothetical protein
MFCKIKILTMQQLASCVAGLAPPSGWKLPVPDPGGGRRRPPAVHPLSSSRPPVVGAGETHLGGGSRDVATVFEEELDAKLTTLHAP